MAIEDGTLHSYVGGWPEYVRVREERAAAATARGRAATGPTTSKAKSDGSNSERKREQAGGSGNAGGTRSKADGAKAERAVRAQRKLEREIEVAEAALRSLESELSDPQAWSDARRSAESTSRHDAAKRTVETLYAQWERIAG